MIEQLRANWSATGISIRPGASIEQIKAFEAHYDVRLPVDLREYFVAIDGMNEGETDNDLLSFHSLDAIKRIPEELAHFGGVPDYRDILQTLPDAHAWFVIGDWSINCAVIAIRLTGSASETPVVWIADGTTYWNVGQSFSEFLETYLANPQQLFTGS